MTVPAVATGRAPLQVAVPEDPAARAAFSRRDADPVRAEADNVSLLVGAGLPGNALAARSRLAAAVGLTPGDVVWGRQVHGAGVAVVGAGERGLGARDAAHALPDVDALVTFTPGVGVAVLAADCVPLLLVDPGRGVAAVHAGRSGLHAGVVGAALSALLAGPRATRGGTTAATAGPGPGEPLDGADRLVALVGPAIGGCCYEVPADLQEEVASVRPAARSTTRWGTPSLDVGSGVTADLAAAGVRRTERIGGCTACGEPDWFSARASAPEATRLGRSTPVGRHAGIVCRLDGLDPELR